MRYLKIDDNKVYYLQDVLNGGWQEIDKINKDDLLSLLNTAVTSEFEMDEFQEDKIANKAHQIIYKKIHEKFADILTVKNKFLDESTSLYKEAVEKYSL